MTNEQAASLYIQHLKLLNVCPNLSIHSDLTTWLYALDYFTHHKKLRCKGWFIKEFNVEKSEQILDKTKQYFCQKFNISPEIFFTYVQYQHQEAPTPIQPIAHLKSSYSLIDLLSLRYRNQPEKIRINTNSPLLVMPEYIARTISQLLQQECGANVHAIGNMLLSCIQHNHPLTNLIASIIHHPIPYFFIEHPFVVQQQYENPILNITLEPKNVDDPLLSLYTTKNNLTQMDINRVYFMIRHNQKTCIDKEIADMIHQQWLNGIVKNEWIVNFFQHQKVSDILESNLSSELKKVIEWDESYKIYQAIEENLTLGDILTRSKHEEEIDIHL